MRAGCDRVVGDSLFDAARAGDRAAAGELVARNAGLIWSVAKRYFGCGADPDDLYQLGCLGFLKAIEGFDNGFGTQFSTYAVPKIAGEIRRFLRDDGPVKVSRGLKEQALAVRKARRTLEQALGREPRLSEISAHTGLSPEEIALCETATASAESLDASAGENGPTLFQQLGDEGQEERLLERLDVRGAVDRLPEKEKAVILLRYWRGMTQERAARVIGVSQVQVSRLEKRAVERLREELTAG